MLREFVEGEELTEAEINLIEKKLRELLDSFLQRKRQEDPRLWDRVERDLYKPLGGFKTRDFIKTKSGKIVMIDPFAYYSIPHPSNFERSC
jgi:hypothetical protein